MPMPKDLEDAWKQAERTGQPVDVGRSVVCDGCMTDYTDSPVQGGIIYQSNAFGPCCQERVLSIAKQYQEMQYLRATCPKDQTFAAFVREYRASSPGGNTVRITSR